MCKLQADFVHLAYTIFVCLFVCLFLSTCNCSLFESSGTKYQGLHFVFKGNFITTHPLLPDSRLPPYVAAMFTAHVISSVTGHLGKIQIVLLEKMKRVTG